MMTDLILQRMMFSVVFDMTFKWIRLIIFGA
jgi:hypothetical protein